MEDWPATYRSPYLVADDEIGADAVTLVEDGREVLSFHGPADVSLQPVAFVDGVRRAETTLYLVDGGTTVRGVAGAHGRGAVVAEPGRRARYERCDVSRVVVWGGDRIAELAPVKGGWNWRAHSVSSEDPDAPLVELQRRMREAEGRLAEELCAAGHLTVVDGPLNFVRSRDLPVVGYVKTHYRPLLAPSQHARIPELGPGQRTSLFRKREDIYSAYLRLVPRPATAGPWTGIVRIELPASAGLASAVRTADLVGAMLPRFAGIPHIDARAPQNLQPIGSLERHLRHLLGDPGLATRAVRDAVVNLPEHAAAGATP